MSRDSYQLVLLVGLFIIFMQPTLATAHTHDVVVKGNDKE